MQDKIRHCLVFIAELDIIFNAEKSCLCKTGSKVFKKQTDELVIGQQVVKWVDVVKNS